MVRRCALRDDQWAHIEGLLPGRSGHVGGTAADNRLFVEAVLYRYRAGIAWRNLLERFGKWKSVCQRFDRWAKGGVWERLFAALSADTRAAAITHRGNQAHVPKRNLVLCLGLLVETGRFNYSKWLQHGRALKDELQTMQFNCSRVGHDSYGAPASKHDDIVCAVALATWRADNPGLVVRFFRRPILLGFHFPRKESVRH
jgi:transposase